MVVVVVAVCCFFRFSVDTCTRTPSHRIDPRCTFEIRSGDGWIDGSMARLTPSHLSMDRTRLDTPVSGLETLQWHRKGETRRDEARRGEVDSRETEFTPFVVLLIGDGDEW